CRRGQLPRVVGMDDDVDRFFCGERLDKLRVHPAWVCDWNSGMKTDHPEMGNLIERSHDLREAPGRKNKRIAAGKDYLPDLGMGADVINGAGERLPGQHRWALAHDFPAKAKAAVDGAKQ